WRYYREQRALGVRPADPGGRTRIAWRPDQAPQWRSLGMKLSYLGVAALAATLVAGVAKADSAVTGDYVESRSANVYVGACHHEGEIQTAGRNAVLAWKVAEGEFHGVSLHGVTAVAVVAGDRYLGMDNARRESVIYVSDQATPEQRDAVVGLL